MPDGNLDRTLDVLDVVELEHDFDLHVMPPQEAVNRPPDRQIGIKRDKRLAVKLGHRNARPAGERMGRDGPPAPSASSRQVITFRSGHFRGNDSRPSSASPLVTRSTTRLGMQVLKPHVGPGMTLLEGL